jgi:UrcA family protein
MRHSALAAASGLAALLLAVPALAQTLDELTITGRSLGLRPQSLSERVSYADLDLTQTAGRNTLSHRINAAAGRVCDQLNEARPSAANLGHSCQETAVRGATPQMRLAIADARSRPGYAEARAVQASAVIPAQVAANDPIPDTPQNRARYGKPISRSGRLSPPRGN